MSGCHPTNVDCKCECHNAAVLVYNPSDPIPCCVCWSSIGGSISISSPKVCEPKCKCGYCLDKKLENLKEKLESSKLSQELDPKFWSYVTERLDNLESELMIVRALGSCASHTKKPHKCPVCDGVGFINCLTNPIIKWVEKNVKCISCEGKGIVWE